MIGQGIKNDIYTPTKDNTLNDFKKIEDFLGRRFKDKFAKYEDRDLQLINLDAYIMQLKHIHLIHQMTLMLMILN